MLQVVKVMKIDTIEFHYEILLLKNQKFHVRISTLAKIE